VQKSINTSVLRHISVRLISQPISPTAYWALVTRPDRGRPTLHGWWAPVALRYIKWWGPAAHRTRFTVSQSAPPTNPKSDLVRMRSQRREDATVITVGFTAPHPVAGLHRLFPDRRCPCAAYTSEPDGGFWIYPFRGVRS